MKHSYIVPSPALWHPPWWIRRPKPQWLVDRGHWLGSWLAPLYLTLKHRWNSCHGRKISYYVFIRRVVEESMADITNESTNAEILTTCQPSWVLCVQGCLFHWTGGSVRIEVPALFVCLSLVLDAHKAIATYLLTRMTGSLPHAATSH